MGLSEGFIERVEACITLFSKKMWCLVESLYASHCISPKEEQLIIRLN
jgi:hypothetical protein